MTRGSTGKGKAPNDVNLLVGSSGIRGSAKKKRRSWPCTRSEGATEELPSCPEVDQKKETLVVDGN